jgi:phosphoribosylformylglycinamidine synthase PurS subunit
MRFRAEVEVFLKPGLLDPQGKAVEGSLSAMGWTNVSNVRIGKAVEFELDVPDRDAAVDQVHRLAERLLANPVIERFVVRDVTELVGLGDRSA